MQYELIRLPVGFNVNSWVNIAIGQDLISLKGFTHHGIAIAVAGQTDFLPIIVGDAEKSWFHVESNPFAGEKTTEVSFQGKVFRRTGGDTVHLIHQPNLIGDLEG